MRWAIILALAAQTALGLTPAIWTNPPAIYTNALGMEFVGEAVLRSRWSGDTNWDYLYTYTTSATTQTVDDDTLETNDVILITTNTITNVFGSVFCYPNLTGVIYFVASEADGITHQLESIMGGYVLPWYTQAPDYSLNHWFSQGQGASNWPGYRYPKVEMIQKNGMGVTLYSVGGTNITMGVETNGIGEVWLRHVAIHTNYLYVGTPSNTTEILYRDDFPQAYWLKRHNRVDPLIVAEWRQYNSVSPSNSDLIPASITITNNWEYYRGWPNEFMNGSLIGDSQLFSLPESSYPVWRVHLGGTNKYMNTLSLKLNDRATAFADWGFHDYDWEHYAWQVYWASNHLFISGADAAYTWSGGLIPIVDSQRVDRAWLALSPMMLVGSSPNEYSYTNWFRTNIAGVATAWVDSVEMRAGDTVSLLYTNRINTYEGTRIWDDILLPEQIQTHYIIFTNMFLTPQPTIWTNSIYYTTGVSVASASNVWGAAPYHFETNGTKDQAFWVEPVDVSVPQWQDDGCPWIHPFAFPGTADRREVGPTNNQAPYFAYTVFGSSFADQVFLSSVGYDPPITNGDNYPMGTWTWSMSIDADGSASMSGVGVDSCAAVCNLWTGTLHRVHFYSKPNFVEDSTNALFYPSTNYYRAYLSGWTTSNTVISPPYSCWSNFVSGIVTSGPCGDFEDKELLHPLYHNVVVDCLITNIPITITSNITALIGYATNSPAYSNDYTAVDIDCSENVPKDQNTMQENFFAVMPVWTNWTTVTIVGTAHIWGWHWTWQSDDECRTDWDHRMHTETITLDCTYSAGGLYGQNLVVQNYYVPGCGFEGAHATNDIYMATAQTNCSFAIIEGPAFVTSGNYWVVSGDYDYHPFDRPNYYDEDYTHLTGRSYTRELSQEPVVMGKYYRNTVEGMKALVEWQH